MKFSRQIIVLGATSLIACGLSVVGSEPAPVADAGGSSTTAPPATSEPILDAGHDTPDATDGGPHGIALAFDGIGDYVRALRTVKDDFTLEAWILTTASQDGGAFYEGLPILWADVSGDHDDFALSTLNGKLAFGAKNVTVVSSAAVNTGTWVHVAVVRTKNGGSMALFVDGMADGTANGPPTSLDDSPTLDIGGDLIDKRYFPGLIREVRVWNKVRTQADIAATMSTRLVGNEPGLVAYWRLDDGAGSVAADSSDGGSKNPGALGDGDASTRPTWVTF